MKIYVEGDEVSITLILGIARDRLGEGVRVIDLDPELVTEE